MCEIIGNNLKSFCRFAEYMDKIRKRVMSPTRGFRLDGVATSRKW